MTDRAFNVLFLCTGNSAHSTLAESILRKDGGGRFNAYSAGSHPKGRVKPSRAENTRSLRVSGSWEEFTAPDAPALDFVFTVCDNAARKVCPMWPGQPMTAHWGIEDLGNVEGTTIEKERAFSQCPAAACVLRFRPIQRTALARMKLQLFKDFGNAQSSTRGHPMHPPR